MSTKKKPSTRRGRPVVTADDDRDTMRPEYDFRGGVRGKYAARYPRGSIVVTLEPDVAAAYPSSAAVNRALRAILDAVPQRSTHRGRSA